jgi:hypothetical protein
MLRRACWLGAVLWGCSGSATVPLDASGVDGPSASDLGGRVSDGAAVCAGDSDCDDNDFCNGAEFCAGLGAPGADTRGCIRRARSAEERMARCAGATCSDRDGDGHRPIMDNGMVCTGDLADDCADGDAQRFPRAGMPDPGRRWLGNSETCGGRDSHDEDCDPLTVAGAMDGDADGDGYPSANCCNVLAPQSLTMDQIAGLAQQRLRLVGSATAGAVCGVDCDDNDPTRNPGAMENPCNGVDDNCDGMPDEGGRGTLYRDCDGDGDGDPMGAVPNACVNPVAIICNGFPGSRTNTDCNDRDPRVKGPGTREETECDGLDNNCDGMVDNGAAMECAIALPGQPDNRRTCTDGTCSMSPGVQTCQMCRWFPPTCARSYDRTVVLNTSRHECEPGELTNLRCTAPGRSGSCGRVVCNAVCEADNRGECRFDREVCDYLDQDCNTRIDEALGRACDQTWQATGNGFAADWRMVNAAIDPMSGEINLNGGTRGRASVAYLPQTIHRSRGIEITLRLNMTRGETEGLGDGLAIALLEAPEGSMDVGQPSLVEAAAGVPPSARGYVFTLGYTTNSPSPYLRIERRDTQTRVIQQVDLPLTSLVTGDTCGGAGTFNQINSGSPSRIYRGGGENEIVIRLADQLLTYAITYVGRTGGCAIASGSEPDASLLGRPLRLAVFSSNTTDRTLRASLRSVRLSRPCIAQGGGTCEMTPAYCPSGGMVCP